jgi:hypothetical protein
MTIVFKEDSAEWEEACVLSFLTPTTEENYDSLRLMVGPSSSELIDKYFFVSAAEVLTSNL